MLYQTLKFYLARVALSLILIVGLGYTVLYFLHEVALQIGAAKVLTKPISAPDLGREISQAVGFAN